MSKTYKSKHSVNFKKSNSQIPKIIDFENFECLQILDNMENVS